MNALHKSYAKEISCYFSQTSPTREVSKNAKSKTLIQQYTLSYSYKQSSEVLQIFATNFLKVHIIKQ